MIENRFPDSEEYLDYETLLTQCDDALAQGDFSAIKRILDDHPQQAQRIREDLPFLEQLHCLRGGNHSDSTNESDGVTTESRRESDPTPQAIYSEPLALDSGARNTVPAENPTLARAAQSGNTKPVGNAATRPDGEVQTANSAAETHTSDVLPFDRFPARFGHFEVIRELGRGGSGIVFLAEDLRLKRQVALKVPRLETLISNQRRARYRREAEMSAGLDHPNIVTVLEAGDVGPVSYIASAYCPGISLARWIELQTKPVAANSVARLVMHLAKGIHHAHSRGVLHRDIKPSNVLLVPLNTATETDGSVEAHTTDYRAFAAQPLEAFVAKIADFGLAKALDANHDLTRTHVTMGTPLYMSPEQVASAKNITTATDIYSLGVVLYELLTGAKPFTGGGEFEILQAIRSKDPRPPRELRPRLSRDLETICLKCLRKEPHRRYATSAELAGDLDRYVKGEPIQARKSTAIEQLWNGAKRRPAVSSSVAVFLLMFIVGFAGVIWQWQRAEALAASMQTQKQRADRERDIAQAARDGEQLQRERVEKSLYFHLIARAAQAWSSNDLRQARASLERCSPDLRDWEWDLLRYRLDGRGWGFKSSSFYPDGRVESVRIRPDGEQVLITEKSRATGERKHALRDARSGKSLTLPLLLDDANVVAFGPHSKTAVAGLRKPGGIAVWDISSGEPLFQKRDESFGSQVCIQFCPQGKRVATASLDPDHAVWRLHIWDLEKKQLLYSRDAHEQLIFGSSFRPDGRWIATASRDGTSKIFDLETGELIKRIRFGRDLRDVAFSSDGLHLLGGGYIHRGGYWGVVELSGDESTVTTHVVQGNAVRGVSFAPRHVTVVPADNGVELPNQATTHRGVRKEDAVIATNSGEVLIVDPNTGTVQDRIRAHESTVRMDLCTGRPLLATCAPYEDEVKIWDLSQRRSRWADLELKRRDLAWVWDASFHPTQPQIAIAGGRSLVRSANIGNRDIELWDVSVVHRPALIRRIGGSNGHLTSVDYNSVGDQIAASSLDGVARIWDATNGDTIAEFKHQKPVNEVAFLDDHRLLTGGLEPVLRIWNTSDGGSVDLSGHTLAVNAIAVQRKLNYAVSGSDDSTVRIWDTRNCRPTQTFETGSRVLSVAWSHEGDTIAAGCGDGTVHVWKVQQENQAGVSKTESPQLPVLKITKLREIKLVRRRAAKVAFHPYGRRLATLSSKLKLWDVESGEEVFSFGRPMDTSQVVEFSPCGRQLLAAMNTDTMLWQTSETPRTDD